VRLAKNHFGSVFGSILQKNCGFWFDFGFTTLTVVSVFLVRFLHCVLFSSLLFYHCFGEMAEGLTAMKNLSFTPLRYDARNDVGTSMLNWFN